MKNYSPVTDLFTVPTEFTVLESARKEREDKSVYFSNKLRYSESKTVDGIELAPRQVTLYLSSISELPKTVKLTPQSWEYTISEFTLPEGENKGDTIELKWLRHKA